ncbi:MAG: sigma-70 family RNA polymerase sigma factor [Candidatus Aminicenantes bacterium]|nr:sigma-70 family RNA polymerase sigma factor [Candidatus Aminicenantes bacterium]
MHDDQELVAATLKGNRTAFEMIIRKYQQPLFNYIGRMVGERELALDFTQDVFLRAYACLPSYRPQFKLSTWLFKIASNLVIDFWRKKKIPTMSLDQPFEEDGDSYCLQVPDHAPSVGRSYELTELRRKVDRALARLPAALRELFVWRHINGLSYEEMAEIKGLPVGTVKNKVFQAKELIRSRLEDEI